MAAASWAVTRSEMVFASMPWLLCNTVHITTPTWTESKLHFLTPACRVSHIGDRRGLPRPLTYTMLKIPRRERSILSGRLRAQHNPERPLSLLPANGCHADLRDDSMTRRAFLSAIASSVGTLLMARAARATPPVRKSVRLGFVGASSSATASKGLGAFWDRLHELGYVEGENLIVE